MISQERPEEVWTSNPDMIEQHAINQADDGCDDMWETLKSDNRIDVVNVEELDSPVD